MRDYWNRAAEFLELASKASDLNVQDRYITIAQQYRTRPPNGTANITAKIPIMQIIE